MVRFSINFGLVLLFAAPAVSEAATSLRETPAPLATSGDFLYAIREVESGNQYNCPPGRFGEQGPYQFRRTVWRQYTDAPFARARTAFADGVAAQHYAWIIRTLRDRGIKPSVWSVAAAWNGGVSSVVSGRIPAASRVYASRVLNIVSEETRLRASVTPKYRIAYGGR